MAYRQYTHCVSRDRFDALGWSSFIGPALLAVGGIVAAIFLAPPLLFAAFIAALWAVDKVCSFLLGGKLICLGGDRCAVGRVVQLEPVGYGKSGVEKIDNDFSVNLLLAPHPPTATVAEIEGDGAQGESIAKKSPELDGLPFAGYPLVHRGSEEIPVLHAEFEGSRIHDFCQAVPWALAALSVGAAICAIPLLGWAVCAIALGVGALIAAAIIYAAWTGAEGGSPRHAEVHPGDGDLEAMDDDLNGGDYVIITGTWCYDSGHAGWNELHPAKSVQKVEPTWAEGSDAKTVAEFAEKLGEWCELIGEASEPLVVKAQALPENEWEVHPVLDGCRPLQEGPR
jgi:hypothetical protein